MATECGLLGQAQNQATRVVGPQLQVALRTCQAVLDRPEHTTGQIDEAWASAKEIQANGGVVIEQVGEPKHIQRISDAIRSTKGTAGEADAWRWLNRRLQEAQAWKALPRGFTTWYK